MTGRWEELCNLLIMECNLLIMEADLFPLHVTSPKVGKRQAPKQGRLPLLLPTVALKDSSLFHSALFLCFLFQKDDRRIWSLSGLLYKVTSLVAQCLVPENLVRGSEVVHWQMSGQASHPSSSWIDKVFTSAGKPPEQKILCRCQPLGFWKDFEIVLQIDLFLKNMNKPCLCYPIDGCTDNNSNNK